MAGRQPGWLAVIPLVALAAPGAVSATVYLTIDAAQKALFPGAQYISHPLAFTPQQRKEIAARAGVGGYDKIQRVWEVRSGDQRIGWFMVDRVIGKHEYITYAVALSPDGAVRGVEILDYRETYGGEVRNPKWRQQFVGKRAGAELRLDRDIRNISGATLSSRHVADGVRRMLVTYDLMLRG